MGLCSQLESAEPNLVGVQEQDLHNRAGLTLRQRDSLLHPSVIGRRVFVGEGIVTSQTNHLLFSWGC